MESKDLLTKVATVLTACGIETNAIHGEKA